MVLVEGVEVKAKRIPKKQLVDAWKTLTSQPFPNIRALILSDEDFNNVMQRKRCFEDSLREIEEWGKILSIEGTDACIFNVNETAIMNYTILIRKNPYHNVKEIILHELAHITRGDL